jgi:hypothetical protein
MPTGFEATPEYFTEKRPEDPGLILETGTHK